MKFKVKYIIRTTSRYGSYDYNCVDVFAAESEDEARRLCKETAKDKVHFKRFKVIIVKVTEV